MYHQWSPYAGARPSTSSHASCWMSVTPEKAIVGTAAETASTSRGCWAMWFISAVAPGVADVLDPAADDVDQAALAVVAPRTHGLASGLERRADVDRRAALVAEHRQRRVGDGEVGVERDGLDELLVGTGLQPHQPLEPRVVRRRRLGRGRERETQRVARAGDRVVAADDAAVGQAARLGSDLVEHRRRPAGRPGCGSRGSRSTRRARRGVPSPRVQIGASVEPTESTQAAGTRSAGRGRRC